MLGKLASECKAYLPLLRWNHRGVKKSAFDALADNLATLKNAHPIYSSQAKIAERAGMDQKTVGRIINKTHQPLLGQLDGLAKVYDLEPWQLLVPTLRATRRPNGVEVFGMPGWPFSTELAQAIEGLDVEQLRKLENLLRSQLELPSLPPRIANKRVA